MHKFSKLQYHKSRGTDPEACFILPNWITGIVVEGTVRPFLPLEGILSSRTLFLTFAIPPSKKSFSECPSSVQFVSSRPIVLVLIFHQRTKRPIISNARRFYQFAAAALGAGQPLSFRRDSNSRRSSPRARVSKRRPSFSSDGLSLEEEKQGQRELLIQRGRWTGHRRRCRATGQTRRHCRPPPCCCLLSGARHPSHENSCAVTIISIRLHYRSRKTI